MVKARPDLKPYAGRKLTVIAWLWARTVKSPNPAFAKVDVPLASTFMLSTKAGKEAYVEPVIENGGYRFTVKVGKPKEAKAAKNGTKLARGANFRCVMSGAAINDPYIKAESMAGRMSARLMAIVAEGERGRVYLAPTPEHEAVAHDAKPEWKPDMPMNRDTANLVSGRGFKQSETESDAGTASTGWETFLDAVIRAGFAVSGTWPVRTENQTRLVGMVTNAPASSIILVCRPRAASAPSATRREFVAALKSELPQALAHLQRGNIAPVDLAQAAIGPGMAVYTRYAKVLDAEGKPLTVREALALINQTLDEALAEQEGDFDADSRWALTWFEQQGFAGGASTVSPSSSASPRTPASPAWPRPASSNPGAARCGCSSPKSCPPTGTRPPSRASPPGRPSSPACRTLVSSS
jgi:adenine-specific DNA methylase